MAKIRNVSPDPLDVPLLGRVVDIDEVVEVPEELYDSHSWADTLWAVVSTKKTTTKSEE